MADKSTKFDKKLPYDPFLMLTQEPSGVLKIASWGPFREGSPEIGQCTDSPRHASFMILVSRIGFSRAPSSIMAVLRLAPQGHRVNVTKRLKCKKMSELCHVVPLYMGFRG